MDHRLLVSQMGTNARIDMATIPYFVFGPNTLLSMLGLLRGRDKTVPTPAEDWRQATVDLVIPALNEEQTIVPCLASVMRQTLRPRRIVLIDDGSSDRTVACAKAFCAHHGVELTAIQRRKPIGKTPTLKRQARELDSDVEFILDGDTILESEDYIARTVEELYQAVGIASACGTILPLRRRDRRALTDVPSIRSFAKASPWRVPEPHDSRWTLFSRGVTNLYREVLYLFLQRFIYHGQMVFFGTITNPVGCAVAYRRKYVKDLFDHFSPLLGDDLTNSEDIFIGMAMLDQGYRNIQLTDVYARTVEPRFGRLSKQVYLWSSSFLQSCYYFDALLRSPFRAHRRLRLPRWPRGGFRIPATVLAGPAGGQLGMSGPLIVPPRKVSLGESTPMRMSGVATLERGQVDVLAGPVGSSRRGPRPEDRRVIQEPYRQAFGRERTRKYGRPAGWLLLTSAIEKVFFPTFLLIMMVTGNWHGFFLTISLEASVSLLALVLVTKGHRWQYFFKGVAVVPIRYALVASEVLTLGRFGTDLWLTRNRRWRK
jgi:glycosyltransferase involved in cell wall biosynthesis